MNVSEYGRLTQAVVRDGEVGTEVLDRVDPALCNSQHHRPEDMRQPRVVFSGERFL